MLIHLPETLRTGVLDNGSRTPQRRSAQPSGVSKAQSAKDSIHRTEIVTAAATPNFTIEVVGNQINVLRDKRTNGLDDFLGNTSSLGVDIIDV